MANDPKIVAQVSAVDHASATLKAIADLAGRVQKNLEKSGDNNVGNALARQYDMASTAANHHLSMLTRIRSTLGDLLTAGRAYAALQFPHLAHEAVQNGEERQHEVVQLTNAGIPKEEVESTRELISKLLPLTPNVSEAGGLELFKELRSVLQDQKEIPHILPDMIKLKSIIEAQGGDAHGIGMIVKGAEVAGIANDPARLERLIQSYAKASQVMGKTITPEGFYEFLKYAKTAAQTLSDRFISTAGMSLTQEMGGSTAGTAINQFQKQVVGGFAGPTSHAAGQEFISLGLADKDDFIFNKNGSIKGMKAGKHVHGYEEAMTDPDKWVYDYVVPALKKGGYDTPEKQIAEIRKMFPNSNAADLVTKIIQQQKAFENHAQLYDTAKGLEAIQTQAEDLTVSSKSLSMSLQELGGSLALPVLGDVANLFHSVAVKAREFTTALEQWQKVNPEAAKALSAGVFTAGAAVGIWLAKGMLSTMGSILGIGGGKPVPGVPPAGVVPAVEGAPVVEAAATAGLSGGVITGSIATIGAALSYVATTLSQKYGDALKGSADDWDIAAHVWNPEDKDKHTSGSDPIDNFYRALADFVPNAAKGVADYAENALKSLIDMALNLIKGKYDQVLPKQAEGDQEDRTKATDDLTRRWGVQPSGPNAKPQEEGPYIPAGLQHLYQTPLETKVNVESNVQGEVKGEVTMMQTVKVEPSPLLLAKIEGAMGPINVGIHGPFEKRGQTMTGTAGVQPPQRFQLSTTGY